jgi:hypothetical protein
MMAKFRGLAAIKIQIMDCGIAITVIGLIIASCLLWKMKKRYLQEVYMLSFLN